MRRGKAIVDLIEQCHVKERSQNTKSFDTRHGADLFSSVGATIRISAQKECWKIHAWWGPTRHSYQPQDSWCGLESEEGRSRRMWKTAQA